LEKSHFYSLSNVNMVEWDVTSKGWRTYLVSRATFSVTDE